jgi:hypothetical protein
MLSSEEPLLLSTNSRRMFFYSPKISSSETRRPKNSSPLSLHRCSDFRPFSCSAAPPIFQESWKSNCGQRSSAPTNFQGMNQKSNQVLSEQQHPGLVFLKARSELDLLLLLSVSDAASVSGTDEGAGKCIEIFAISLTV